MDRKRIAALLITVFMLVCLLTGTAFAGSSYTVEFHYDGQEYVLQGGESVPLADVLSVLGLSGEVQDACVYPRTTRRKEYPP